MKPSPEHRSYNLHGFHMAVSGTPAVVARLDDRFRLLPKGAEGSSTISFEFESVSDSSCHTIARPEGAAKPFYEIPGCEAYAFENGELLYVALGSSVRALCRPKDGRAQFSAVESAPGSLFFVSHLLFTIFLMEMLKHRGLPSLHAAGFAHEGRAVLIPGTSGAGKSTLSIALLRANFGYLTDDMIFLNERNGRSQAFGLPEDVDVTAGTIGFFPELKFLLDIPKADGFPKWQVRAQEVYGTQIVSEAEPGAIVFPRISGKPESFLRTMSADEALFELVSNVLLTEPQSCQAHLQALSALVRQTPCYRLHTGTDFDRIPELFRGILSPHPVETRI